MCVCVYAVAYLNLGLLLAKQGRQDEAAHWLRICSQLSDKAMIRDVHTHRQTRISALLQWAKLEAARSQHDRALGLYHRLLEFPLTNNQRQVRASTLIRWPTNQPELKGFPCLSLRRWSTTLSGSRTKLSETLAKGSDGTEWLSRYNLMM